MDKKELATLRRDVKRAERRVGDSAKWLFDFAYRDLTKLDRQGVVALGLEILAVALAEDNQLKQHPLIPPLQYCYDFLTANGLWSVQRGGFVDLFQSQIRRRFEDCKLGRWWEYQRPQPVERFTVFKVVSLSPEGTRETYARDSIELNENGLDYLLRIATEIVHRERDRFGICGNKRCGIAFVAQRKNRAKYCSPKCAAYVRVNRKRGKL